MQTPVTQETSRTDRGEEPVMVNVCGQTDAGTVRPTNQDHYLVAALGRQLEEVQSSLHPDRGSRPAEHPRAWLLMVADGMGGHDDGAAASARAIESSMGSLRDALPELVETTCDQVEVAEETLRAVVRRCNRDVLELPSAEAEPTRRPGTTLTLGWLVWPRLLVAHAGDSRCYLLRQGTLHQITRDHTLARDLVEHAGLAPDQARSSRWADLLTNTVGGTEREAVEPEVYRLDLEHGDTLLLCSDGLHKVVSPRQIAAVLSRRKGAEGSCHELVAAANQGGGPDNITAVVASFHRS
jgi:protein phosphatase